MEMEWSNVTIKSIETKYEGTPGKALLNAVDKAMTLYNSADYKGALNAAKKVLWFAKTDADKFWGHYLMARSLSEMNDAKVVIEFSKAIEYCTNYYGAHTQRFLCHNDLGVCYMGMNMPENAMKVWKAGFRFAETSRDHWTYYINMGRLYGNYKDFHNELKMVQSALDYAESDGEIAECFSLMSNSEFELSESDLEGHGREVIRYSNLCLESVERILSNNQGDNLSRGIPYWRTMACFCYRWMSIIYEECGEKDKAIEVANYALEYAGGDKETEKEIYATIARCSE